MCEREHERSAASASGSNAREEAISEGDAGVSGFAVVVAVVGESWVAVWWYDRGPKRGADVGRATQQRDPPTSRGVVPPVMGWG